VDINTICTAFEPDLYSVIQTTQVFLPLIRKVKTGHTNILLITTSLASNTPNSFLHRVTAYNTAKVQPTFRILTIALAHELESEEILIDCMTHGFTTTRSNGYHEKGKTTAQFVDQWTLLGQPEDKC
ncbi:hypothetical protein K435DRAFT_689438, partial [Dendrothele bispora CBS 962.96]